MEHKFSWLISLGSEGAGVDAPDSLYKYDSNYQKGILLEGHKDGVDGSYNYTEIDFGLNTCKVYCDAFETKNIFYTYQHGHLLISNDIYNLTNWARELLPDLITIYRYLSSGYIECDKHTFFEGIYKLKAGECLEATFGRIHPVQFSINSWYKPKIEKSNLDIMSAVDFFDSSLSDYMQKFKDEKICLSLSSGYDSTLLKFIFEDRFGPMPTLTHAFRDTEYNEYSLAKDKLSLTALNNVVYSYDDIMTNMSEAFKWAGRPLNGIAALGICKVCQSASNRGFTHLMSGIGESFWFSSTLEHAENVLNSNAKTHAADRTIQSKDDYLNKDFVNEMQKKKRDFFKPYDLGNSTIKKFISSQQFIYDAPKVNSGNYIAGALSGVTQVYPYLSIKNFEICLSLNEDVLHFDNIPKSLINTLVNGYYSSYYATQFPKGIKMIVPQREYVRGIYRQSIEELIRDSKLADAGIVDKSKLLTQFINYSNQAELGNAYFIWKFIATELWYRTYFDKQIDLYYTY